MARPIRRKVEGVGVSQIVPFDIYASGVTISVSVRLDPGTTATYTVEHTFDDVFSSGFDPDEAVWYPNDTLFLATNTAQGNYAFPITAARLRVVSSDGAVTMTAVQGAMAFSAANTSEVQVQVAPSHLLINNTDKLLINGAGDFLRIM